MISFSSCLLEKRLPCTQCHLPPPLPHRLHPLWDSSQCHWHEVLLSGLDLYSFLSRHPFGDGDRLSKSRDITDALGDGVIAGRKARICLKEGKGTAQGRLALPQLEKL